MVYRRRGLRRAPRRPYRGGRRVPKKSVRARLFRALANPQPTFTETFRPSPNTIQPNVGQLFTGNIGGLPQYAQYTNLYNQYRINWVKVMLIPDFNTAAADENTALFNATVPGTPAVGMARIVWAIQNTPLVNPAAGIPANEAVVLQDNGCKISTLATKWSCSFKPVVATQITSGTGVTSLAKMRMKPFLNFTGNPLTETIHYGVQAFITQAVSLAPPVNYNVYYKINFTLRDPK